MCRGHVLAGDLFEPSFVFVSPYSFRFANLFFRMWTAYKGFNKIKEKKFENFKIFKGMEYDTFDVGHVLIILPEGKVCNEIKKLF